MTEIDELTLLHRRECSETVGGCHQVAGTDPVVWAPAARPG
ncbi:MAG: hypothetical protein ACKVHU_21610 [Acidimicrobiales bacterium]